MTKFFTFLSIGLLSISFSYGQDTDEYSNTLKEMLRAMGSEQTYQTVVKQMISVIKESYSDKNTEFWTELEKEMSEAAFTDLTSMMTPVYQKYMTQDDLKVITAFYNTQVGSKLATNTPLITQEAMEIGQVWGKQLAEKIIKKIEQRDD